MYISSIIIALALVIIIAVIYDCHRSKKRLKQVEDQALIENRRLLALISEMKKTKDGSYPPEDMAVITGYIFEVLSETTRLINGKIICSSMLPEALGGNNFFTTDDFNSRGYLKKNKQILSEIETLFLANYCQD